MIVVIEGPDGAGKSTLVDYLVDKYKLITKHSSSTTENTYDYHVDLVKADGVVLDRANLGEIVYPCIYGRDPKMTMIEQEKYMEYLEHKNIPYIIFYASDFDTLSKRLYKRGDTAQVIENAEKINLAFTILAKWLSAQYKNVYALDITKTSNQIQFFEEMIKDFID